MGLRYYSKPYQRLDFLATISNTLIKLREVPCLTLSQLVTVHPHLDCPPPLCHEKPAHPLLSRRFLHILDVGLVWVVL